ncbi:hypothetical protein [Streptomyces sp. DSM 15324]|uniref:hypothetical protein n=1 Tax=Streptomyces sp. DSM 15324 TaxID=1739111 RepID=UPI002D21B7FA|nr:hypothetical protein [Streptomyces sp. DSM 15324]
MTTTPGHGDHRTETETPLCRSKRRSPARWIITALAVVAVAVGVYPFQPWRAFTTVRWTRHRRPPSPRSVR